MTPNGWLQILFFLLAVFAVTPIIGGYMAQVFTRRRTWLDPILRPVERLIYRLTGVDDAREMRWTEYAVSLLMFSVVSMLVLYAMQRLQHLLPFNPQGFGPVAPALAFNTAVSFTTNTNWQAYSGESTMSYFTQMAGLAYHNFVSAAVGISVAIAFIRGIAQKEKDTLGNFWVDMVRATLWVLLPIAIVGALFLVSQGVVQNLKPYDTVQTVEGAKQVIAQGPAASQEIIKQFGTNGGGFFNANSSHPFENPTPLTNFLAMFGIFAISSGLTYTLGTMTGSRKHGWAVWGAMAFLFLAGVTVAVLGRSARQSDADRGRRRSDRDGHVARRQHGGQGSSVRHRQHGAVRHGHHRRQLRRDQRLARLVYAARRAGADGEHPVERSRIRRRRRGDVRRADLHHPLGVHRGSDGRKDARVPRQEDPGVRGADGDAHRAHLLAADPDIHGDLFGVARLRHLERLQPRALTACRRCSTRTRRRPATTGPHSAASASTRTGTTRHSAWRCCSGGSS